VYCDDFANVAGVGTIAAYGTCAAGLLSACGVGEASDIADASFGFAHAGTTCLEARDDYCVRATGVATANALSPGTASGVAKVLSKSLDPVLGAKRLDALCNSIFGLNFEGVLAQLDTTERPGTLGP